ncbi:MAG TPA: DUF84 family protein [Candidatus Paceibacterota bacterium]|nr:DUF84 family protein [Candidatus Paceibacterota bacterium]HPT18099.1 DUF84 family protein [Candidatus Paceibacterota bacterium]
MKIGVGSKNKTKINAVSDLLKNYPMFKDAEVFGVTVNIEEFGHPKNIKETVSGAVDRAKQSYKDNDFGFGIEGGLMEVPYTKSGYMEVAACAIFDGKKIHIGLSSACEWPKKVIDGILNKGLDGSQATKLAGLTEHEKLGEHGGIIEILTKGRMNRTDFNKTAVAMALIHLENPEYFD